MSPRRPSSMVRSTPSKAFADKYRNGPVVVTRFSLSLGISPSLNVDFEFR
jgi:hypothetical protein